MRFIRIGEFFRSRDWGGFLLEVLSVALGVVLTFAGEAYISHKNEVKDVKEALGLVRDELLGNIEEMDSTYADRDVQAQGAAYLSMFYDHFDMCDPDSMNKYCNKPLTIYNVDVAEDAFELLKISTLINKIEDRSLALDITKGYKNLKVHQGHIQFTTDKINRLFHEAEQEQLKKVLAKRGFTAVELWSAITSTPEGRQFLNEIIISHNMENGFASSKAELTDLVERINAYIEK